MVPYYGATAFARRVTTEIARIGKFASRWPMRFWTKMLQRRINDCILLSSFAVWGEFDALGRDGFPRPAGSGRVSIAAGVDSRMVAN